MMLNLPPGGRIDLVELQHRIFGSDYFKGHHG
ncbi:hypothetical protein OCH239_17265 [Roseivivax halodurans JCM 10272]|uniref:Uncharacterized protein n=1 Tax=Roseivivax halodurans JCM 10272 TaxID=1449350 RepID=X7EC26_9RHOB|nr:hypothetical protein OCH239_17265 [Roseivivax halodurans JCM 10272]